VPASVTYNYMQATPLPGTPRAPSFKGTNVTEFLHRWEEMCTVYRLSMIERVSRLPSYCELTLRTTIQAMKSFKSGD